MTRVLTDREIAALGEVVQSAATDQLRYTSPLGCPTWDEHRVGRMLARDECLAEIGPVAVANLIELRMALREVIATYRAEARTSDSLPRIKALLELAGGA